MPFNSNVLYVQCPCGAIMGANRNKMKVSKLSSRDDALTQTARLGTPEPATSLVRNSCICQNNRAEHGRRTFISTERVEILHFLHGGMASANSLPDLQSILADLARFATPAQSTEPAVDINRTSTQGDRVSTPLQQDEPTSTSQSTLDRSDDPLLKPQSRSTASPKPIDPATITTWQEGLRCVTKIAAQNAQFAATIRRVSRYHMF